MPFCLSLSVGWDRVTENRSFITAFAGEGLIMRGKFSWFSPLVALVLVGPILGADKPLTKDQIDKLIAKGEFSGKLAKSDNSTKNFTVQVEYYEADPAKVQALQQYSQTRLLQIRGIRNAQEKQRQLVLYQAELAKREAEAYKKATRDVALEADDGMKVRLSKEALPPKFDEKGKVVKYTTKELSKLKGPNKSLPGYTGEWENLNKGQTLKIYLAKKKKTSSSTKDKSSKKDKDEPGDKDEPLKVRMILVQKEAATKD
jgi:hypothetical protein